MPVLQRVSSALPRRRLLPALLAIGLGVASVTVGWVVLYRVVPPPGTPLMLIRAIGGAGIEKDWVGLEDLSGTLPQAVIASEDSLFCSHAGFDWESLRQAWQGNLAGRSLRGGSTITMQTAKNAYLWQDRTYLRKGLEAWFTLLIELVWPKARIMEVYLNIIEWGDGIYGAEAAARAFFDKPASALTRREAALMAAVLPNPLRWSPAKPTRYIAGRANVIQQRMAIVERDGLNDCIG
ncbi:monofunctional biosynthetic peptidoglycan transglycosylase [Skermanella mucosa]|uniref:monofunctional biosynthetic peptidoglycan transglycosylase n=1 Tax=Skermanella mucosa TaxID=1789672 RepID=UPI00192B5752|nr:monofunctional biosynthetic peptidoglycan transglycosylase [Skermanella mucosa]UEM18818.1 monofunctional biosynthetic peptidoglycan transglycosylase [Skermanella mucosa]